MQKLDRIISPLGALLLAGAAVFMWSGGQVCAQPMHAAANDPITIHDDADPSRRNIEDAAPSDPLRQLVEQVVQSGAAADSVEGDRAEPRPTPAAESRAAVELPAIEWQPLGKGERQLNDSNSNSNDPGTDYWFLKTLSALALVVGLVLLLRWGWMRLSGQPRAMPSSVVEVLSRTTVAPRNHVLLLRVGGRILVVGDSAAGLRTLAEVREDDEVAELLASVSAGRESSITRGFSQLLNRSFSDYETGEDPLAEGKDHQEHLFDRTRDRVSSLLSRIRTLSGKGEL